MGEARLWATSDLHVGYADNRRIVTDDLHPAADGDWLIVAGDIAEKPADVEWTLATLAGRFAKVLWSPGNHELYTHSKDPVRLRGLDRYEHLVALCRDLGVITPEDEYPRWSGAGGPVTVAPLFLLYDYTFRQPGQADADEALEAAYGAGAAWCHARVRATAARLAALPAGTRTVLVNHWPLTRLPTRILRHPQFAIWCGTELTADWHTRFAATAVVYGHLHIPRTTYEDGVRFEEVSLGYPREWRRHGIRRGVLRDVLPAVDPVPEPW